jgi:peptide/nickel transport system permease protein
MNWRAMMSDTTVKLAVWFLGTIALLAFIVPLVSQVDPNFFDPLQVGDPQPPSLRHLFGTDDLGRDLLIRSIYGARISLMVGIVSAGISVLIGIIIGTVAGYVSGWVDELIMRVVDMFMAIPSIFLLLTIQIILKPSIFNVMVVIGLTSWMGVSRLVRAEVMSLKERPFVVAAHARNLGHFRVLFKHILPHAMNPIIVSAMLSMGSAILVESVLSFLGLGVQPPHASWGNMLDNSLAFMRDAPWMAYIPGILITLTVLAINFVGDGIRTGLDPRGRHASR